MSISSKLTTEEIFTILVAKVGNSNFELVNFEFNNPGERMGYLGEHAILSTTLNVLDDTDDEQKDLKSYTFFVKFFPIQEMQAVFCDGTGAFKKEIFMYDCFEKIRSVGIPYIDCVPKCYFSKSDVAFVTENLLEKGYRNLDKMNTFDYDTVLVIIRALAKLHASTIIYEEKISKDLGRSYRLSDDHEDDLEESFYNDKEGFINLKGVDAAIKALCSEVDIFEIPATLASGKDFKSFLKHYCYRVYDLVKRDDKYRNVLCHGDLWSTNILLKFNTNNRPVDCKLVDYQWGRYLPPSHDVMSMMYLVTSREFRQKYMYEILGLYYTNLEKYLKLSGLDVNEVLTIQDFLASCEQQKFFALFQTATYFQLVLMDGDKLEQCFTDIESNEARISEDRTVLILNNGDEKYRKRLKDSMLDLKEYCEYL